jgi:hypothetical protein
MGGELLGPDRDCSRNRKPALEAGFRLTELAGRSDSNRGPLHYELRAAVTVSHLRSRPAPDPRDRR